MLDEIMHEIEKHSGPMTVKELARRVSVEESALEGMLEFLERKGRLVLSRADGWERCRTVACMDCVFGRCCPGAGEKGRRD